jgi:hypothetical protein
MSRISRDLGGYIAEDSHYGYTGSAAMDQEDSVGITFP